MRDKGILQITYMGTELQHSTCLLVVTTETKEAKR